MTSASSLGVGRLALAQSYRLPQRRHSAPIPTTTTSSSRPNRSNGRRRRKPVSATMSVAGAKGNLCISANIVSAHLRRRRTHNAFKATSRWAKPLCQSLSGEHACSESNGGRVGQIHALQFVTGGVQMRFHGAKS